VHWLLQSGLMQRCALAILFKFSSPIPATFAASPLSDAYSFRLLCPLTLTKASHLTLTGFCYGHRLSAAEVIIPVMDGIRYPMLLRDSFSWGPCISDRRILVDSSERYSECIFLQWVTITHHNMFRRWECETYNGLQFRLHAIPQLLLGATASSQLTHRSYTIQWSARVSCQLESH